MLEKIKKIREKTGAGMVDVKKLLNNQAETKKKPLKFFEKRTNQGGEKSKGLPRKESWCHIYPLQQKSWRDAEAFL